MSIDEELVEFLKARIRSDRRMLIRLLLAQAKLRKDLSKGASEAEEYRDCAMSDEDWLIVEPVAGLLFDGQWVSRKDYDMLLDVMIDYADEFARLLPPDRIHKMVPDGELPAGEDEP